MVESVSINTPSMYNQPQQKKQSYVECNVASKKNKTCSNVVTSMLLSIPATVLASLWHDIEWCYHPKKEHNVTFKEWVSEVATQIKKDHPRFKNMKDRNVLLLRTGFIYAFATCISYLILSLSRNNKT